MIESQLLPHYICSNNIYYIPTPSKIHNEKQIQIVIMYCNYNIMEKKNKEEAKLFKYTVSILRRQTIDL